MEADSTTYENSPKEAISEPCLPFATSPGNFNLYKDLSSNETEKSLESQIVEKLQAFGLIPKSVKCPTGKPECKVICKAARVIDRVQWTCEGCGKRQPIRTGSFFLRLQCSILQALQIILAWCEDADCELAAKHFGVKPRVASTIYDRLDDLAVKEQHKCRLGGENSVVLAEMYPDCLNQFSPDTTDQPHVHRILMLADTNHIPTSYHLHVIRDDLKKHSSSDNQSLIAEVEQVISKVTLPNSTLVTGSNVPPVSGASNIQQLIQHCDVDMQHFLSTRIWRQAQTLCAASRDLCVGAPSPAPAPAQCSAFAQRYLHAALYRLGHARGYFAHVLALLATEHTDHETDDMRKKASALNHEAAVRFLTCKGGPESHEK